MSGRAVTGICSLVCVIWAASIITSMLNPTYKPDPAINTIFGGVIGAVVMLIRNDDAGGKGKGGRRR